MNEAISIVRRIQNANPTGLRSLFLRYGIGADTTPRNVILATMAFGDAFTAELYSLDNGQHNFDGTGVNSTLESGLLNYNDSLIFGTGYTPQQFDLSGNVVSTPASTSNSGNGLAKFTSIFNSVAGLVSTGANIFNQVKSGQTVQTPEQQQANAQLLQAQMQQDQATADAKNKQMLIIGAVLVLVLLAGFLIFRKR